MKSIAHSRKTVMNRSNVKKKKRNVEHHHGLREREKNDVTGNFRK